MCRLRGAEKGVTYIVAEQRRAGGNGDNSVTESFFGTLQVELLDEHTWHDRDHLAVAIFEWIEAWNNPHRRHSYNKMLSPIDYETAHAA